MSDVAATMVTALNESPSAKKAISGHQLLGLFPGILLAIFIAAMSLYVERRYGGPVMLYALLIGIAFNPMASNAYLKSGITFSANNILKLGVALLAVKITVIDVVGLGWQTAGLVLTAVGGTLVIGTALGRLIGLTKDHAILSAGSVAICGSSAALAIASVLPQNKQTECNTIVTVIAVTTLSTIAMVLYPLIATLLNFSDTQSGVFMGATIHNVAQVVGAGYMISDPAGEVATIVKLMRVACLVPAIILISLMFRQKDKVKVHTKKPPLLPFFMIAFILTIGVNSLGLIPTQLHHGLSELSRWCLVIAVAALGLKTSVSDVIGVGIKPLMALMSQTLFLALFALFAINFILTF